VRGTGDSLLAARLMTVASRNASFVAMNLATQGEIS
jgi:hypothetical protein